MRTVWKFPLAVKDEQDIDMPFGAKVLAVQAQGDLPCLWAAVDSERALQPRHFSTSGTGHPLRPEWPTSNYVGTYQLSGGTLVFHVFETA